MGIKNLFLKPVNYLKEKAKTLYKKYPYWVDLSVEVIFYGFLLSVIADQLFNFKFSILGLIALGLLWHFISVEFVHLAGKYRSALR